MCLTEVTLTGKTAGLFLLMGPQLSSYIENCLVNIAVGTSCLLLHRQLHVYTLMPGDSYCRQLGSFLCLCATSSKC